MQFYGNREDKIEFRDIVFKAKQKVLDILSKELRLYKKVIPMTHRNDLVIEEEDTRESFVQAVQGLAIILRPYFDKQMSEAYGDFDELVDMYFFEFFEQYKEYIKKTLSSHKERAEDSEYLTNNRVSLMHQIYKVKRAKQIFKELNLLLKRVDYLKSAVYGEDDITDIDEEGEE